MSVPVADEERVLILSPRGRDAQVVGQVLDRAGTRAEACPDMVGWLACLQAGAGAALVTEEALADGRPDDLFAWLDAQPPWSDFPSSSSPPARWVAGPSARRTCSEGSAT